MSVRDFAASLPRFGDDPVRRLAHTLAALESAPDDRHAVDATTGFADLFGQNLVEVHPGIPLARVIELSRKYRPTNVVKG